MNANIVLYSNHCPICKIVEKKLKAKDVKYSMIDDIEWLLDIGFETMPVLKVDNSFKTGSEIFEFIDKL